MKKIISVIAAFCMLMSITAFAATTDAVVSMTADVTTAKPGDKITYTVSITGDSSGYGLSNSSLSLYYDPSQIEFDLGSVVYLEGKNTYNKMDFQNKPNATTPTDTYIQLQCTASKQSGDTFVVGDVDIWQFKGTVKESATGDIKFRIKSGSFKVADYNFISTSATVKLASTPVVTITSGEPAKPVISLDPSNPTTGVNNGVVDITKNDETGAYSVKVKAPIGKKAVIYLNGVAQTGTEISGTATENTTIKVEYVEDNDYAVITYPIIYKGVIKGTTEGVVVFGKGTIDEGDEYGIKLTKGEKSTKYKAEFNAAGIFGVAFIDGEGEYTAQAYVNDATGRVVSFTK